MKFIGREKALGLLERVIDIQNMDGGMKNEQFDGYKTPGGVFIYLFRNAEDFSKEETKKLLKEEKKLQKKEKYL